MRITTAIWTLLYALTTVSAAASRNLQSSTPRYKDEGQIDLENRLGSLDNSSQLQLITSPITDNTGLDSKDFSEEISRKLKSKPPSHENFFRLKTGNSTNKVKRRKPTVKSKVKSVVAKPVKLVVDRTKNQTVVSKKKVVFRTPPLKLSTTKYQNSHYKNYTKFRIKPMNKQAEGINPVISTYSPEYPVGSIPQLPIAQDNSGINPEITSNSPPFSIGETLVQQEIQNPEIINALSPSSNPFGVPISQVVFQSLPVSSGNKDGLASNDCPSFQVSSYLYGPQRQGCSDISVVLNSQYTQNSNPASGGGRPAEGVDPVADPVADPAADPVAEAPVEEAPIGAPLADDPGAVQAPAAEAPAATNTGGTQGGGAPGGGFPGGGLPQLPQLSLPDLKVLWDLLGGIWNILRNVFGFLANPYLYIVPAVGSFLIGFLAVLAKFKFFVVIPGLLLYGYLHKDDDKPKHVYHKHPTEVIHHHDDGWFYNHNTKKWENILQYMHPKKIPLNVGRMIEDFGRRYEK